MAQSVTSQTSSAVFRCSCLGMLLAHKQSPGYKHRNSHTCCSCGSAWTLSHLEPADERSHKHIACCAGNSAEEAVSMTRVSLARTSKCYRFSAIM